MGSRLTASSIAEVNPFTEVNGLFSDRAVQIVTPQSLAHFPRQSVQQGLQLEIREVGQGQSVIYYPCNFILELCCPIELVLMEMFHNVYCPVQQPRVTWGSWALDIQLV